MAELYKLKKIIDQLPGFVCAISSDYTIDLFNSYFVELFGEPAGRKCHEIFYSLDKPCEYCPHSRIFSTKAPQEWKWKSSEGRIFLIKGSYIEDDGPGRVLEIGLEITEDEKERKRIEELEYVVNKSPAVVFLWKAEENWPVEMVSENISIFGYIPDDFLSGRVLYSSIIHPDDLERVAEEVEYNSDHHIDEFEQQYRIIGKDGDIFWINDFTRIRRDSNGIITHYQGIILDITEIRAYAEKIESLSRFPAENPNPVIRLSPDWTILYANEAGMEFLKGFNTGIDEPLPKEIAEELKCLVGRDCRGNFELESGETTFLVSYSWISEPGYTNIYCADITEMKKAREELYSLYEQISATEEELRSNYEELFQSQEEVKRERDRAQNYLDVVGVIMVALDAEGRVTLINKKGSEILGYTEDEVLGTDWFTNYLNVEDTEEVRLLFEDLMSGEIESIEFVEMPLRTKSGNERMIAWHNTVLKDDGGRITGTLSSGEDITERKEAEERIANSEARFRELFNTMRSGVAIYRPVDNGNDFEFVDFNSGAEEIDKIRKEEVIGKRLTEVFPGVEEYGLLDVLRDVLRTGERRSFPVSEYKDQRITGWRDNRIYKLPSGEIVAIYDDITDKKMAEEALLKSEAYIRTVLDNLPIGVAVNSVDPSVSFEYFNENFLKIYRTTSEALLAPDAFWNVVYEDPIFREEIRQRVLEDSASGDPDRMHWEDIPITRAGEETTYICARNIPVPDENLMISTVWDVTERKNAEDSLKRSKIRLAEAMDLAHLVNWEFDVATGYFTFDDRFYALYGTTGDLEGGSQMPAEVYVEKFVHPEDQHVVADEVKKAIEATDPKYVSQMEHRIVRRDGEIRYIVVRFGIIKDETGRTITTHGANQDITERKLAEEGLIRSLREKDVIIREIHHRVKNNLQIISALVQLQEVDMVDEISRNYLDDLNSRILSMARVYEALYDTGEFLEINMKRLVDDLITNIMLSYPHKAEISFDIDITEETFDLNIGVSLSLIISELFVNVIKHAFIGREKGNVRVSLLKDETGAYELAVSDDGVGYPGEPDISKATTLGMRLLSIIVQKNLHGTVEMITDGGTKFIIRFWEPQ